MRHPRFAFFPVICLAACGAGLHVTKAFAQDRYAGVRAEMVAEFIEAEGIDNRRVLAAMRTVPRHLFVRPPMLSRAYEDAALAIGHRQTISPPFVVAYMTQSIDPQPEDKVLEIGTGSGYQAAVLAELVNEVYTIEIVEPLGKSAARVLKRVKADNVKTRIGDGYKGWPEAAPFDKIIVTCSPEKVPRPLVDQLAEGGRMIIPLGERYQQVFYLFRKENGKLVSEKLIPTLFVPMTGISEDNREQKPDPANPRVVNGSFEIDANDDGKADNWHYQRRTELVDEGAAEGSRFLRITNSEPGELSQALQGMALDGREVPAIRLMVKARPQGVTAGPDRRRLPGLSVVFYDSIRKEVGSVALGPFGRTESDWRTYAKTFRVPANAREAIIRVALNGGAGTLDIDAISLEAVR
ncbi:protein-L-isoaspartate(D-aspartate) O-methyltransferase [Stratiformator vulcanicus]|uniref:Protein-L-isoaspartate O-methyltransferase n=1 Tax=Stratiformator vulcanicus TaxID=2527980 RepID=A0A517R4I3_9PLAN|nr:protein-L-isoaspartate(D-aspartate) O-methyltransferase [Stratiformator vulcanicus]QDT38733.1 Protein-L-isoaspartate O-methyltransferase [Stratiformator vulcanicus]